MSKRYRLKKEKFKKLSETRFEIEETKTPVEVKTVSNYSIKEIKDLIQMKRNAIGATLNKLDQRRIEAENTVKGLEEEIEYLNDMIKDAKTGGVIEED